MQTCIDRDPAVLDRLEILGLPKRQSVPILREIKKWVDCSGEEETVKRLKTIRNDWLHYVCGLPIDRSSWVARHPDGSPKGPFKVLFSRSRDFQTLAKTWNILCVYSRFEGVRVTKRQLAKWMKGVRREAPDEGSLKWVEHYIDLGFESLSHMLRFTPPEPLGDPVLSFTHSPVRRAPTGTTLSSGTAPEIETALESVRSFAHSSAFQIAPSILGGTILGVEKYYTMYMENMLEAGIAHHGLPPVIGRIAIIQEAGLKARCIANPGRAWQQAFGPLFRFLERCQSVVPGNYAMDQEAGRVAAMRMLQQYNFAVSIDLEGATDNIPLELQIYVLQKLGVDEEWIDLVRYCSQGMWILPGEVLECLRSLKAKDFKRWPFFRDLVDKPLLQWTQGQPLGLKFSFHLFSLTLGLVYEGVSYSLRQSDFEDPTTRCKRVQVGDDLVCFDKLESDLIQDLLQSVGIPVSKDKTLESTHMCEFTSRLVTSQGIIAAPKWRDFNDDNFFDYAKVYGPSIFWVYPWKWKRLLYLLENVPEKYGGLGFNPLGIPEVERAWPITRHSVIEVNPETPSVKLEAAGARARRLFWNSGLARLENGASLVDVSNFVASDQDAMLAVESVWGPFLVPMWGSLTRDLSTLLSLSRDMLRKIDDGDDFRPLHRTISAMVPNLVPSEYPSLEWLVDSVTLLVSSLEDSLPFEASFIESKPVSKRRQLERLVRSSGLG